MTHHTVVLSIPEEQPFFQFITDFGTALPHYPE